MTIGEAINTADNMKPNQYDIADKIKWLSDLDGIVKKEIIDTHEGYEEIPFTIYTRDDLEKQLLIPDPYSDVYIKYLFSEIDFNNAEFTRYNNSVTMYNNAYVIYQNYYNRTHMPLQPNVLTL